MTYPNGRVLNYNYTAAIDAAISRLSSLSDSSATLESFDYLGLATVVKRAHSQPGVDLTYIKQSGESTGDAGDQYTGLDRFGRGSTLTFFDFDKDRATLNLTNGVFEIFTDAAFEVEDGRLHVASRRSGCM